MRHSFRVMEELGAECDRLGIRVVDVHGESGSASDFLAKVARYIEAREMELHDRRWIPVTERLPEAGQTVMLWNYVDHRLGWLKYTANGVAYFFSTQDECNIEPTHWMPLPAPPTDGK